jgi:hypothetical protein
MCEKDWTMAAIRRQSAKQNHPFLVQSRPLSLLLVGHDCGLPVPHGFGVAETSWCSALRAAAVRRFRSAVPNRCKKPSKTGHFFTDRRETVVKRCRRGQTGRAAGGNKSLHQYRQKTGSAGRHHAAPARRLLAQVTQTKPIVITSGG